ncbi:MAG: UPF0158 family protein [Anaerolineae bacterium]|jgi:hypothetical protein
MTEKRKVQVDLNELEAALTLNFAEQDAYLDLETGEVITLTGEIRRLLEDIYDEIYDEEGQRTLSLAAYLAERDDIQEWRKQCLLDAARVEAWSEDIIAIDAEPHADYRDMERFIQTVDDPHLRERLWRAIDGRGAFRYFRDVLTEQPDVEEAWYAFKDAQIERRVRRWLEAHNIEPV